MTSTVLNNPAAHNPTEQQLARLHKENLASSTSSQAQLELRDGQRNGCATRPPQRVGGS